MTAGTPSRPIRASDQDRNRTVAILRQATAEGYLTLDEFSERLEAAFGARYVHDLPPLTADIPIPATPRAPAPTPGVRRTGAVRRAVRVSLSVFGVLLALAALSQLWLPLLILGVVAWRRGWCHGRRGYPFRGPARWEFV